MSTAGATVRSTLGGWRARAEDWVLGEKHASYGIAVSRILVGAAFLGILVTNLGTRYVLWGPASTWTEAYRADEAFGSLHEIFGGDDPTLFTLKYVVLMAVAVAVMLGWRTRVMTAVLLVGMTALVERNSLVGDQGDNIARIGLFFMLFMSTAEHWSLDSRRRRLALERPRPPRTVVARLWAGLPVLPAWWTTLFHNVALVALAFQIFILYTASALFKVQGELWQNGTALYYPLGLHEYGVFPGLNHLLTSNVVGVTAATYFAVFVQLFFAVGLLHPVTRRFALVGVVLMHLGIAVLMGLPWFSLSMLAFDSIFVSTTTFVAVAAFVSPRARRLWDRVLRRAPEASGVSATTEGSTGSAPAQGVPADRAAVPARRRERETVASRKRAAAAGAAASAAADATARADASARADTTATVDTTAPADTSAPDASPPDARPTDRTHDLVG